MSNSSIHSAPGVPEEVRREIYEDGEPLAYDHDFNHVLLERTTRNGIYVYTGINRTNGKKLKLGNRTDLPMETDVIDMLKLIRISDIAGIGRLQADRPIGEAINIAKAREILETIIDSVLPEHNYYMCDEQKDYAYRILNAIIRHEILPVESEMNEFSIICSLIAAVITKRGRMNDFHIRSMYPQMQYADMPKIPIVISVPSIALQRKLAKEQIPGITKMLLKRGIIRETLTFVERKGRENYACIRKAMNHLPHMRHENRRKKLDKLLKGDTVVDLADIEGLSRKDRTAISVDNSCSWTCPNRVECKFIEYMAAAKSYVFDIQICTHRYLFSDTLNRLSGNRPLIPNYQALIVCDAFSYLQAAAELYTIEIPNSAIPRVTNVIRQMSFRRRGLLNDARETAKKLTSENARLFRWLVSKSSQSGEEVYSIVTLPDAEIVRHLKNIRDIADRLIHILYKEAFFSKAEELLDWVNIKYCADVSVIDLNGLIFGKMTDEDSLKMQVEAICGAICDLSEVKNRISAEFAKKKKKRHDKSTARRPYAKYAYNTENEAIYNMHSKIKALIWEKASLLLKQNVSIGARSEKIIGLISDAARIRNRVDTIVKQNNYNCRVSIESEVSRLYAVPKEFGKKLFSIQRENSIPTILMSGKLPEDVSLADFEQELGL